MLPVGHCGSGCRKRPGLGGGEGEALFGVTYELVLGEGWFWGDLMVTGIEVEYFVPNDSPLSMDSGKDDLRSCYKPAKIQHL